MLVKSMLQEIKSVALFSERPLYQIRFVKHLLLALK